MRNDNAPSRRRVLTGRVVRYGIRSGLALYLAFVRVALRVRRAPRPSGDGRYEILVTLKFYSDNWAVAMLRPMALAPSCARLRVVAASPVPALEKVEALYPPSWLRRLVGDASARLLTLLWVALRSRPHWVGGFHLLLNGLTAAVVAPLVGSRSFYVCGGGPAEVLGGGGRAENRLFGLMDRADPLVERRLLQAVDAFDAVVTMGTASVRFFQERGVTARLAVASGGIDGSLFRAEGDERDIDVIALSRLFPVKRLDLFLRALRCVADVQPGVRATVVGTGPLRGDLERLAHELALESHVHFAGFQPDVAAWLRRARIVMLPSDTEGLPLSLVEAMLSGAVPVASRVGELADLVEDEVNGYLVAERTPEAFAAPILALLAEPGRLRRFSSAAREAALRYDMTAVSQRWDAVLRSGEAPVEAPLARMATGKEGARGDA